MKQGNVVVTGVLVVAVLLAACGLGLLIRQARMGDAKPQPQPQVVAEPNVAPTVDVPASSRLMTQRRSDPTPEELAAVQQQRAEERAAVAELTEEQRQERRDALRAQLRTQSRQPGQVPHLSPQQLQEISRRWPEMSEQEKQAFRAMLSGMHRSDGPRPAAAEPNASDGD